MDDGVGWGFIIMFVLGLMCGCGLGTTLSEDKWECTIVDKPDVISAIRSRILAERAEVQIKSE